MSNPLIPQTILPGANLHSKHSLNPNGAPIINPDRRSGKTSTQIEGLGKHQPRSKVWENTNPDRRSGLIPQLIPQAPTG